jgi:hypothetical protein
MVTYAVDLSEGITESFFVDLENFAGPQVRVRKRLIPITLELFQNIRKHAINMNGSSLTIQKENSTYTVLAVNTIAAHDVTFLQDQLHYINTLDHIQLREQHTKILSTTKFSKKSGAGLGLYRIALRSALTLVPVFRQLDQHNFTFSLHVTLAT